MKKQKANFRDSHTPSRKTSPGRSVVNVSLRSYSEVQYYTSCFAELQTMGGSCKGSQAHFLIQ